MKLNDIDIDNKNDWLKITDLENQFNISIDSENNYVYNLNLTLVLAGNEDNLPTYVLKHDMFWPLISYKLYGTTRCAWMLMKVNKVKPNEIFDIKHAGESVKYIDKGMVTSIVDYMNLKD